MKSTILCLGVTLTVGAIAGLGLCAPNLMWLQRSTLRISNKGNTPLKLAQVSVGQDALEYESIEPGESEFALLPKTVEGSIAITLPPGKTLKSFCHSYVESKMYHVDVVVKDGQVLTCQASLPILSELWVMKAWL